MFVLIFLSYQVQSVHEKFKKETSEKIEALKRIQVYVIQLEIFQHKRFYIKQVEWLGPLDKSN